MSKLKNRFENCPFESGAVELYRGFLSKKQIDTLIEALLQEDHWNNAMYSVAGRQFTMPRVQSWYADPGIVYNFTHNLHKRRQWSSVLSQLKQDIEHFANVKFNSVLINWYRDGNDWVDWHSDNEIELGQEPLIISISLGEARKFGYRRLYSEDPTFLTLENGSLLIMYPAFQKEWQHCIFREPQIISSRVNLTFRYVVMPAISEQENK